jgi:hypothetical protein
VVDEAIDVRLGVKVFVPVMLGLGAFDPRDTALEAEGVTARPDGVRGRKLLGVLGAKCDFWLDSCGGVSGSKLSSFFTLKLLGGRFRNTSFNARSISSPPVVLELRVFPFGPRLDRGRRCVGVGIPVLLDKGGVPIRPGVDSVGRRDILVGLGGVTGDVCAREGGIWPYRFLGELVVSIVIK